MTTFELCPYCDEIDEYEIPEGRPLVQCRHCGNHIELCSICEDMNCEDCDCKKNRWCKE